MTPEKLEAIKQHNKDNPDVKELITEIEGLRSRIGYLEGYKEAVEETHKSEKPSIPQSAFTPRPNMPFFTR